VKAGVLHIAVTVFIVAIALVAYDRMIARPARLIGVVDVGEVYRLKEAEFTQIVTKSASEDERERAVAMARQFAQRLPVALEELPRDCACLVVVRTAVVGVPPNGMDLTALLKRKLDLP
jgi:hypothetical protein